MKRETVAAFQQRRIKEQRQWIQSCGGTLAGYIANYHGEHGRTIESATNIFKADTEYLAKCEAIAIWDTPSGTCAAEPVSDPTIIQGTDEQLRQFKGTAEWLLRGTSWIKGIGLNSEQTVLDALRYYIRDIEQEQTRRECQRSGT